MLTNMKRISISYYLFNWETEYLQYQRTILIWTIRLKKNLYDSRRIKTYNRYVHLYKQN